MLSAGVNVEFRIRRFDELDSTNLEVKRAIDAEEPEGLVVCARRQSNGYGRQGRTWASPEGGLYLSVLLRPCVPIDRLPTLSLVAGLAVREAAASLTSDHHAPLIKLKWPNDVVVAGGPGELQAEAQLLKLAGLSLEMHRGAVCLGIGVNVHAPASPLDLPGKYAPAFLADYGFAGDVDDVAERLVAAFASRYALWEQEGLAPFLGEYEACSYLSGRAVRVRVVDLFENVLAEGRACGVDAAGRLLVDDGVRIVAVSSGEAHLV